jgi:RNA polymerase primary sigma factor
LDVTFEEASWEKELQTLQPNTTFSALRFLTLMEEEPEEAFEEALQLLQEKRILLDIQDLPKPVYTSEAALRLRREEQLVKEGTLPQALEENDPLRLYLEELASVPVCGDPAVLAEKLLAGDQNAAPMLTDLMLSRVIGQAFQLTGKGVLLLDLIQEGSLGLWQGLLSYTGGDIEAHCDWCIRWDLARAITTHAREAGVGQRMKQAVEDYRAVDESLLSQLGRNPTVEEIAEALHMTPEEAAQVARTVEAARTVAKAKAPEPETEDPEDNLAVEDTAYFQTRQRISELLSGLTPEEAKLLTLRFGLEGGKPLSPADTGRQLGLTPEEVVAQEAAALQKLRNA